MPRVELGFHDVDAAEGGGLDLAALGHELAVLEHVARRGEHGLRIGLRLVEHDVGGRPVPEVAAVGEPEDARRSRRAS